MNMSSELKMGSDRIIKAALSKNLDDNILYENDVFIKKKIHVII